jgi:alpha-amylase
MITLVLAFHNHQPVGNFDWVVEEAYQKSYRRLMEEILPFPAIRFAQHYTGILFDWFATHHPEFLETIAGAVRTQRVELLSGGYYEPKLAMLPERDRLAQIMKLNIRIRRQFGVDPAGMWLAERVWEPSIPSTLHEAGIGYTFLDDTHFKGAGLDDSALSGYFLTEDQGRPLAIFPIDKRLRYTMPFEPPETTIDYLRSLDTPGEDRVVVFADDGEKFGVWPDTFKTVYEEGWLRNFCALLTANSSWVRTLLPGEVIATRPPAGRIYIPTGSYSEMLHWALPTSESYARYEDFEKELKAEGIFDEYDQFVRGGFWRNFMVKYPEANTMQKKMLRTSDRLERTRRRLGGSGAEDPRLATASDHLLAAQCNCPYWHGVFGGLYLGNIRQAIYREMIRAGTLLDAIDGVDGGSIVEEDFDLDGCDEVIFENRECAVYIAPAVGGGIFAFDYKPVSHNLIDLLGRREEGYHRQLREMAAKAAEPKKTATADGEAAKSIHDTFKVKEAGLERLLCYDNYRHGMLIDHFPGVQPTAAGVRSGNLAERGDFVGARYESSWKQSARGAHTVKLSRKGRLDGRQEVIVEKIISLDGSSADMQVEYTVRSVDGSPLTGTFAIEYAAALSAGTEPDRYYELDGRHAGGKESYLNSSGESEASVFAMVDEWLGIRLSVAFSSAARLVRAPLETVSLSEQGLERNYQGSIVLACWPLAGKPVVQITLRQRIERLR